MASNARISANKLNYICEKALGDPVKECQLEKGEKEKCLEQKKPSVYPNLLFYI